MRAPLGEVSLGPADRSHDQHGCGCSHQAKKDEDKGPQVESDGRNTHDASAKQDQGREGLEKYGKAKLTSGGVVCVHVLNLRGGVPFGNDVMLMFETQGRNCCW
jgi:hypothetical protein